MEKKIDTKYGQAYVKFNTYTGKKYIALNDISASYIKKREYEIIDESLNEGKSIKVHVNGDIGRGVTIVFNGFSYVLYEGIKWYELLIIGVGMVFCFLLRGNAFKSLPILGGNVGGLIAAGCLLFGAIITRMFQNPQIRALVLLGFAILGFLVCLIIGLVK